MAGIRDLRDGAPLLAIALTAAAAVVWMILAADQTGGGVRGYAELVLSDDNCSMEADGSSNVVRCIRAGPDEFHITFRDSLEGSTAFATPGSCCRVQVSASVTDDRTVTLRLFGPKRYPTTVSVLVP